MKLMANNLSAGLRRSAVLAAVLGFGLAGALAVGPKERNLAEAAAGSSATGSTESGPKQSKVVIETIEPDREDGKSSQKDVPYLGVSTVEASDSLGSQLGLNPGAGLVASYIVPESPAAKAGLKKNDVLVEFNGQLLVHPAQLRKLVQMRKVGDTVKVAFYHAGKKEEVSVTLDKTKTSSHHLHADLHIGDDLREEMKTLHETLAHGGLDNDALKIEIHRGLEQARGAVEEALRQTRNARRTFGPAAKVLEELARSGVQVDKDATVTVKSSGRTVKTMVKADDSGTYVIVADPKKRLTVHDKKGKLLFDGEIETPKQQEKMPREIREKIKLMLEQLGSASEEDGAEEDSAPEQKSSDAPRKK